MEKRDITMGNLKNVLTKAVRMISFEAMCAHLDDVCVTGLSESIRSHWEIKRGLTLNPDLDSLIVHFRSRGYGQESIVQAYEYHGLTIKQAKELADMVRSFDKLTCA